MVGKNKNSFKVVPYFLIKEFVIVRDDENIMYVAIRTAEESKRVNHERKAMWF